MKNNLLRMFSAVFPLFLLVGLAAGQGSGPVAQWDFDQSNGARTMDSISRLEDNVNGYFVYAQGVSGKALRFDGYTTSVTRLARQAPVMGSALGVSAWIAPSTYPWNWVPIVDYQDQQQGGYYFGVDAEGHIGMSVEAGDRWQTVTSESVIPLKKWSFVAGTYDPALGLSLYIDGKQAGHLNAAGKLQPPTHPVDLLIGRIRDAVLPYCYIHPKITTWYSFDGLMDDVSIYNRGLDPNEIESTFAQANPPKGEVLSWPLLPAGPSGTGSFGAYSATLKFEETWDRLGRLGPEADVVVRFDVAPIRLVFWHGLNYIPAWVTENGKWYTDEFLESGYGGSSVYDAEPMSDKQTRYSRVNILESSSARAVVHWRYALTDVLSRGAHEDPLSGWFDWADEYYTVYPDGVAIRKQVLHHSDSIQTSGMWHEWQETIIVHGPGTRPEDNIQDGALTLVNMAGQTATYSWLPHPPKEVDNPANANIQVINLKSEWKPFQVAPQPASFDTYTGEDTRSTFEWWNHWPVGLIDSSGRCAVAPDRPSHSSLSHIKWPEYAHAEDSITKILMDGLTKRPPAELAALAKSWLHPAAAEVRGAGFESKGYDAAERAFVVKRTASDAAQLNLKLTPPQDSSLLNPAVLVKNWNAETAQVTIDGKTLPTGTVRVGIVTNLDGTDLVIFIRQQSPKPMEIAVKTTDSKSHGKRF
jgi:hypothetical protein